VGKTDFCFENRYFLSAVEVYTSQDYSAFATVGDSITDGRGSDNDNDKNNRWPDLVLARMQANDDTSSIAVINQAAGGNRILYDDLGPNALGRIDRDVLSHSGVQYAMIFEGVNDIGTGNTDAASPKVIGDHLIAAFKQIVIRLQAADITVFAATITPFSAPGWNTTMESYSDPEREKTRRGVNKFIRESGIFDAVIDFDKMLKNEMHPEQLQGALQGGDYLHPNAVGYKKISDEFPLDIF
jgi:lysophospholipase L1-like esterase